MGLVLIAATATNAAAAEPAALVESVHEDRDDIRFLDYLDVGTELELAEDESVRLAYFVSCRNETITGGQVIIGEHQSQVSNGDIEVEYVDCDGVAVVLDTSQSQETATVVFRKPPDGELPAPDRVIYDTSPLIKSESPVDRIVIRRLDQSVPDRIVSLDAAVVDLRDRDIVLAIGGLYEFSSPSKRLLVKVSTLAQAGSPSAISRLIVY
ncbi:MAG: hypothetical protein RIC16_12835 [Rhodospirillales bacterium]